ncbi:MAG: radical SAM protein [Robiginitomaculum sp.]|nr:MAG: radical SAM protein [Robiginitomaculum sp.]
MDISTNTITKNILSSQKFSDPNITAKGETRAHIDFKGLQTLWFNTGSLCNIECINCYIKSSPSADHFVYLTPDDMTPFLDEIDALGYGKIEIAFTGGEPYLNPYIFRLSEMALERGHTLLVLTNAMKPMMRPRIQKGILDLQARFGNALTLRVSLDHYTALHHDEERGTGSFDIAMKGMNWLSEHGVALHIAGRTMWGEAEDSTRKEFAKLIAKNGWNIDAQNLGKLILFPEMDETVDVPEITNACWDILNVSPDTMMCSSSRMVVKNKGSSHASVLACTLLWDDPQFDMGPTLEGARAPVKLNHPHCSKFCVLGGASCSG